MGRERYWQRWKMIFGKGRHLWWMALVFKISFNVINIQKCKCDGSWDINLSKNSKLTHLMASFDPTQVFLLSAHTAQRNRFRTLQILSNSLLLNYYSNHLPVWAACQSKSWLLHITLVEVLSTFFSSLGYNYLSSPCASIQTINEVTSLDLISYF